MTEVAPSGDSLSFEQQKSFLLDDELIASGSKHCAALFLGKKPPDQYTGLVPSGVPGTHESNGTLTFIKRGGRLFGITAWHVIETLRCDRRVVPMTRVGPPQVLPDRFQRCGQLDLAIQELPGGFCDALDKTPLECDGDTSPSFSDITYGYAIGFPGRLKRARHEPEGSQLVMPCATVLAEIVSRQDGDVIQFYSGGVGKQTVSELGGMSGGPVFWSDGIGYHLIGVVFEAAPTQAPRGGLDEDHRILYRATRVTPLRIAQWITDCQL